MRVTQIDGENVTIEAPAEDVRAMALIAEAAIDSDEIIRNTTNEETVAITQTLKKFSEYEGNPIALNITKKELRDLSMILAAVSAQGIEDYFPQLLDYSITEDMSERLEAQIWDLREEVSPAPK